MNGFESAFEREIAVLAKSKSRKNVKQIYVVELFVLINRMDYEYYGLWKWRSIDLQLWKVTILLMHDMCGGA